MSGQVVEKIANAVLYEGYLLYPYRSSAVKNRQRWNFGIVYPRAYSEAQGGIEPWEMETQCLAVGGPLATLSVKGRCLRMVERVVGYSLEPDCEASFVPSAAIEVYGRTYESWQEAGECEFDLPPLGFGEGPVQQRYALPSTRAVEPLRDASGSIAGLIVRTQAPLEVWIEASVAAISDERVRAPIAEEGNLKDAPPALYRVSVKISNVTPYTAVQECADGGTRLDSPPHMSQSLLSTHTILRLREGEFVSSLEPPAQFQTAVAACRNVGTWPVLAGEEGQRDTVLSSPIILYDYPQIAPESPGDLFDGGEIDEILSLRILTLTDEEKSAMRRSDDRAREILERTESLPAEHFMKLHGVLRALDPSAKEAS